MQHPAVPEPYVFLCDEWMAVDLQGSGPVRREYCVQEGTHGQQPGKSTYKVRAGWGWGGGEWAAAGEERVQGEG